MQYHGLKMLNKLISKLDNGVLIIKNDEDKDIGVSFKLNPPAKIEDIKNITKDLGLKFPNSFENFLLNYNGGTIFDYDGLDGFEILGTDKIQNINKIIANEYGEDWIENILIFAECIGEGNYIGFRINDSEDCEILDCFHEDMPEDWEVISNDFDDFLLNLIKNNGVKFWLS